VALSRKTGNDKCNGKCNGNNNDKSTAEADPYGMTNKKSNYNCIGNRNK
jgi:hypothetical protein